ncbi:DUF4392 domain-containing protein [bacterium]|nr:DUF4392 domain-containing protein [bacterium]
MDLDLSFKAIERIIWDDPGRRGVHHLTLPGDLARAATSLLAARRVTIVTGFYIIDEQTYETDGPPGARAIGHALELLEIPVEFLVDSFGAVILRKGGLQPVGEAHRDSSRPLDCTHLIAVERLGRAADGRYYSMRGRDISSVTEPLDQLFIDAAHQEIVTIGIGDGGNEIGMGKVSDMVMSHIPHGGTISSTVATDFLITAGTSNWGAWGLVAALSLLAGRNLLPNVEEATNHLSNLIDADCCDGVTGRRELSVDGLAIESYLAPLPKLHELIDPFLQS